MKKWVEVNGFGELFLEIVLVRFDIPLLFVCIDKNKDRYLVLCVDEELGQYLAAKCSNEILLAMLNDEVSMEEPFKNVLGKKLLFIRYNFDYNIFDFEYCTIEEVTQDMLPDEGAYFKLKNKKIENYITKLKEEVDLIYKVRIKSLCENYQVSVIYQYDNQADGKQYNIWNQAKVKRSFQIVYCINDRDTVRINQYATAIEPKKEENCRDMIYKGRQICNLNVN